jgi:hypothetical protein
LFLEKRVRQTSLAVSVRFFQSQIERSFYKIGPLGKVNRRLLVGLIEQQLAEGRTATEVAMAAAEVMASNRKMKPLAGVLLGERLVHPEDPVDRNLRQPVRLSHLLWRETVAQGIADTAFDVLRNCFWPAADRQAETGGLDGTINSSQVTVAKGLRRS